MTNGNTSTSNLDSGVLAGIVVSIGSSLYFFGELVKKSIDPGETFGAQGALFALCAMGLMFIFVASLFSLIATILNKITDIQQIFWEVISSQMIKLTLLLALFFVAFGLWFIPPYFFSEMVKATTNDTIGNIIVFILLLIWGIVLFSIIKSIPDRNISFLPIPKDLFKVLGIPLTFFFFSICILLSMYYLRSCYIFELRSEHLILKKSEDLINIEINLGGRILEHDKLSADIYSLKEKKKIYSNNFEFNQVEPGYYVAWRQISDLEPGTYKIVAYFSNYSNKPFYEKFWSHVIDNNWRERNIILRVL